MIERLLAPLTPEVWAERCFATTAVRCEGASPRVVVPDAVLAGLIAQGRTYDAVLGYVDASPAGALDRGQAVVTGDVDQLDADLGAVADALSADLHEPCRINLYATPEGATGFPLHADTHDVFVVHLAGEKRWQVTGPSLPDPLFHPSLHPQTPPADPTPYLETTLTPGDVLYVPRGHWHRAETLHGPSIHLTIAVFFGTGIDVLHHLTHVLHHSEGVRQSFAPRVGPALRAAHDFVDTERDHVLALRGLIDQTLADPSYLASFRSHRLLTSVRRPATSTDGVRLRWRAQPVLLHEAEDAVWLDVAGQRLQLPAGCTARVRWMAEQRSFGASELDETLVNGLLAQGVLERC